MIMFGLICLLITALVGFSIVFWSLKNGISPMPSSFKASSAIIKVLPSDLQGVIYELGSGWGTLALPLAKAYPNARVEGFENSFIPYIISKLWQAKTPNLHFHRQDFFAISLKDASAVVCYLYPGAMEKLSLKFNEELPPGCWVISNTFALPGWKPIGVIEINDLYKSKVFVYRKI